MNITVNYKPSDFPEILAINNACYKDDECPPEATLRQIISVSDVFQMRDLDGTLCGFAIAQSWSDSAYLWSLAVDPHYQKCGYGRGLLKFVTETYRGMRYDHIRLHVHENNPAQKLYFDAGFRVYDLAHGYYKNALGVMMKLKYD